MDARWPALAPPQFSAEVFLSVFRKSAKADKVLKTKGKISGFSLPKAENMLKTSQLLETQKDEISMPNCPPAPSQSGRRIREGPRSAPSRAGLKSPRLVK